MGQEVLLLQRNRARRYISWNRGKCCTNVRRIAFVNVYKRWMTFKVIQGHCRCYHLILQMSRFKWRHHNRCGGTLHSLPIEMLHGACLDDGVLSVSRKRCQTDPSAKWLTENMGLSLSSECHYWGGGPGLWRQTVPRPRGSHRKRTVTEGGPTSWRHQQRRWVDRA